MPPEICDEQTYTAEQIADAIELWEFRAIKRRKQLQVIEDRIALWRSRQAEPPDVRSES